MNEVLDKNLKLLEKYQPYVFQKIEKYINGEYVPNNNCVERILLAQQDDIIFNILVVSNGQEYLLCNHEDPIKQSYEWIDKFIDPLGKAEIVFGMGMAFHLEVLITSFKNKKVIIVEPNIELFFQILKIRNLELIIKNSELFVDEQIDLILNRVNTLFLDTDEGRIQCEPFEVYASIFEDLWNELRNKVIKGAQSFIVDISTRRYFAEKWIFNYIKNTEKIKCSSNANGLIGSFKGVPGILVSAGPSLSKNMNLLNEIKDRCVIMAAGTAVNILEDNGIEPHFMMGIDASEEESQMHNRVKSNNIYFLYSNQVAPGSIDNYKGPKFLMNYSIDKYTEEFLKFSNIDSEVIYSGPSVANTCFDMLYKMGCNPIILIGQDLAYTDGRNYASEAKGSVINENNIHEVKGLILAKDIYGNDIYTIPPYIAMKNWFEGHFERVKSSTEIINATEGGLNIEGAINDKFINLVEKIKSIQIKDSVDKRINDIYLNSHFNDDIDDRLKNYKEFVYREMKEIEKKCSNQIKLIDLIKRDIYNPSKDKKSFDKVVYNISHFVDLVIESPIYNSILSNLVSIDFYLIKIEVERATKEITRYEDAKDIYIEAILRQNEIIIKNLDIVKKILN